MRRSIPATRQLAYARGFPSGGACWIPDGYLQYLWERACSRRGRHIRYVCCLTHRFREQARSHRGRCWMETGAWSLIFAIGRQRPYLSALEPDQTFLRLPQ
ncbi:hypothetical protein BSZ28_02045 [Pseudomonas moraviensis]|nr:hypothetical protein BSZ28_02045 [Pseudomonas moraviensis]